MSRPIFGFSTYSDSALADKATQIHNMMSGLPVFTSPPITYAMLLAIITNFNNAIAAAINHDKVKVTAKRDIRVQLEATLKSFAIYIMSLTSDQLQIEETGFDATTAGTPVGIPGEPQEVSANSDGQRAVRIDWKRVHGAFNYLVEMTTSDPELPNAVWTVVGYPTQSKFTVQDLSPLTYYWFRVRANGAAGIGQPSTPTVGLSI